MSPNNVYRAEYDTARELDLPISLHANLTSADASHIGALAKRGLLYPQLQLIHGLSASEQDIALLAEAGSSLCIAPVASMKAGMGLPRVADFTKAGVKVGLSIDSLPSVGNADMFALMKLTLIAEAIHARSEFGITQRRLLELATLEGAETLGLDHQIGSLTPGKRADVIMVNTRHLNLAPYSYADRLLVEAAQPANVDTVIVDGRILKRGGRMTTIDVPQLISEAEAANLNLREKGGWV